MVDVDITLDQWSLVSNTIRLTFTYVSLESRLTPVVMYQQNKSSINN